MKILTPRPRVGRRSRAALVIAAAVLALGGLSACGGSSASNSSTTLTMGTIGEMNGLDPIRGDAGILAASQARSIYDTLIRVNEDGMVEPYLARSLEPNENLAVWTLGLREGVKFHDGTTLDADAVAFNFERHLDPNNATTADVHSIESVKALDPLTVEFTLIEPFAQFPATLTTQAGWIASPTAIKKEGEGFNTHPVGAGPFKFERWVRDQEFVVVRNDNYWGETPAVEKIAFKPIPDGVTRLASVRSGDVDVIPSVDAKEFKGVNGTDLKTLELVGNGGGNVVMNTDRVPQRIRQAIAYAFDKDKMNEVVYEGSLKIARGFFDDGSRWHDESASEAWATFDLQKAKDLVDAELAETGKSELRYGINFANDPTRAQFAQLFKEMMKQAGITIDINALDVAKHVELLRNHDFDIATQNIEAFTDPIPVLQRAYETGGARNYGLFSNKDVDAAFAAARRTTDESAQRDAYATLNRVVGEQASSIMYARSFQGMIYAQSVDLGTYWGDVGFYAAEISIN